MKNSLLADSIMAALSAERVGIAGLTVLGAEGGGPGAMSGKPWRNALTVVVLSAGTNSCTSSVARHCFASGSESHHIEHHLRMIESQDEMIKMI